MASATYVFEVMWDGAAFVDETANVWSLESHRGKDYASQLTGKASAGRFRAVLKNEAGRFASFNTASPLFGMVLPARKVRLRTTAPVAEIVWTGYLDSIAPDERRAKAYPKVTLSASGPLKYIAERKASTQIYAGIVSGTALGHILDDAGWPAPDRTLDTGLVTMTRWGADGDKALSHIREIEETELGYIGESADGKIVFEDLHHRQLAPHITSQATFRDDGGAGLFYQSISQLDPWRDIFNTFEANVQLYTIQALAVLWAIVGEVPQLDAGEARDFWAQYPTSASPAQAAHVDAWTTPVSATDFVANSQADGLGTNLTANVSVVATKFAKSMKIRVTNNGLVEAYLTTLQARGTPAYKNDPIKVVTEDTASQALYGKRTYPLPGKFYPSTAQAKSFTEFAVSRFKGPLPVLRMKYLANSSDAHMLAALALDVSDRITVIANKTPLPGTQLGISRDFNIEAINFRVERPGNKTWVTYDLSDALGNEGGYWVLGVSTLGESTRLNV